MKKRMFLFSLVMLFCIAFLVGCKSDKKPNNSSDTIESNDIAVITQSSSETTREGVLQTTVATPESTAPKETTPPPAVTTAPPVPAKLPNGEKVTSIKDLDRLDVHENAIAIVKAFLEGDRAEMDSLYSHRKDDKVFSHMGDLKISSFEVWSEKKKGSIDNTLFVTINVSESRVDTLPVGTHTLTIASFYSLLEKVDRVEGTNRDPKTETEKFMSHWLNNIGYLFTAEYKNESSRYYLEFMNAYYHSLHGEGGTKEEYIRYYKTLFGKEPGPDFETVLTFENGGKGQQRFGHGKLVYWYDFVESGEDYVTIQFYADHGYLLKGPKIKYNFVRMDGILVPKNYEYLTTAYKDIGPARYLQ